jgi:hypothetical protein
VSSGYPDKPPEAPSAQPFGRRSLLLGGMTLIGATLSGCVSDDLFIKPAKSDIAPPDPSFTPKSEQVGQGSTIIGLLASDEIGSLSGGAPNAIYLAAKLAIRDFASDKISVVIRRVDNTSPSLRAAVDDLVAAKVSVIVGPADDASAAAVASMVAGKNIAVLSLARVGNVGQEFYGAGIDPAREAQVVVDEMKRRAYSSVLVIGTKESGSDSLAASIVAAAKTAGIAANLVTAVQADQALGSIRSAIKGGAKPAALMFASSPDFARGALGAMGADKALATLPLVGPADWGLTFLNTDQFAGAWYPTLALDRLKAFADKFATAYSATPTLNAAIAYDLMVLASALPQVGGKDPFRREIMTTKSGFTGQTGAFSFDAAGLAQRPLTVVTNS